MKKGTDTLNINRPPSRRDTLNSAKLRNVDATREHILQEIIELESQLDRLKCKAGPVDFSMIQTYREMIATRKRFFEEISKH